MSETDPVKTELEMILAAVHSTIMAEPYCFLITLDESGQPQARMVGAARVEPNFQIWIITSATTAKQERYDEKGEPPWPSPTIEEKDT